MSYIIVAEVNTDSEINHFGVRSVVDARILSERDRIVTYCIHSCPSRAYEDTKRLVNSLLDAEFYEFSIRRGH